VSNKRARIYDGVAVLTLIVVIALDQWTKALVVDHLSPPESHPIIPLIGKYLVVNYIQNRGVAFGLFANSVFLVVIIVVAIAVVCFFYLRMINTGPLVYKIVFGMIIGGALGNLLDRAHHSGYVIDFISFRIPEINYYFAIFNVADACISVGMFLLCALVLFNVGGMQRTEDGAQEEAHTTASMNNTGHLRSTEQDAQS
jgi:signal peptidase II